MRNRKSTQQNKYTVHNRVRLVEGGKEYFTLLRELIDNAQHSVHLQIYIFDEDETGNAVAEALINAAARNVEVYLLFDGYASKNLSKAFQSRLIQAGIHFRMFEPLLKTPDFYFGRRLHHKVVVIDALRSLVSGINISNKYNDVNGEPPWLDWAIYAEGEISYELLKVGVKLWTKRKSTEKKILARQKLPKIIEEKCLVRVRRNDWVKRKTEITKSYLEMFKMARSHITVMSSYFLPGTLLKKHMNLAAKRNVKIKLILAGNSDVRLSKYAERYIYRWLFRNNIEIYEYQKSILHGKLGTYDNRWTTIGSYNLNNISAFASIELNLDVDDPDFASTVQKRLDKIIESDCIQITPGECRTKYNFISRFFQWVAYMMVRFLFYLFTFYFRQG